MECQYTPSPSEPVVVTAEVDASNAILLQRRCTHDAGFNCYVEVCGLEGRLGVALEHFRDGEEFCVSCPLERVSALALLVPSRAVPTFMVLLVSFIPRATIWSLCTRTHPTGVSLTVSAFSPWFRVSVSRVVL